MRAFLLVAAAASLALLGAAPAAAQTTPLGTPTAAPPLPQETFYRRAAQPPASAWETRGLLGLELEARGGFLVPDPASPVLAPSLYPATPGGDLTGDILRGTEKPYGYAPFALSFTLGYRLRPFVSAGLFFDYASFQVNDGTDNGDYRDGTQGLQRQVWHLGLYGRYYVTRLSSRLQPWIELDAGYSDDTASYTRGGGSTTTTGQPLTEDYFLTQHGIVASALAGLDWRLAPFFAVGPLVGYERVFALNGCVDAEPQGDQLNPAGVTPVSTCSSPPVQANGYGAFFAGVFAKVTIGPSLR